MKDIYRNPIFYYILVPVVIALWPILVWALYLPRAQEGFEKEHAGYYEAERVMMDILALDPDRLEFADANNAAAEFDYAKAVQAVASLCSIKPDNYKFNSGMVMTSAGRKSQSAKVSLKSVGVKTFARFLSTIQLRWADLQCTKVKLTKKKGLPDAWDVDLDFKYYY
ncbi:MAG: hypothetical protein JSU70_20675 [Phycisphaerales bacterium]|nr:MAG: hypothetical protein JSU70_20675 [Phycisphaerales bacterium]